MKKRIISMLLVLVTMLGMLPATALAASSEEEALGEVDIYNDGTKLSYLSINGRVRELIYTYYNYVSPTGKTKEVPAYCVNPNIKGVPQTVGVGESIKYLAQEKSSDPKVMGIVANGYPTRGLSELKLENLSPEREAVVRTACSLVGKVNYFWGGKSGAIGWDSRWGTLMQVTAVGSPTTGTYRPYGLDCSGFVDWVFNNATGYIIGHGGGAIMQHSYCTNISWADAQPGDLVFYPGDSHVGIVGGWDEDGNLLIIHCSSGYNNVVITGKEGFTAIARPNYYTS